MDTNSIRAAVNEYQQGVIVRMIDGTEYTIPHRDYIWLTPSFGNEGRSRMATSFWLHDAKTQETKLVNAMLVKEIVPMKHSNGNGHSKGKRGGGKQR